MWYEPFVESVSRDRELRELTSVRVGGRARWLVAPVDDAQTGQVLRSIADAGLDHRVLGGGSNLLPGDADVQDVVIHPERMRSFDVQGTLVRVGAGLALSSLVARANGLGLAGAHVLAGIPGQVGGAVAMNAGGRYGEIGPLVRRVHVRLPGGEARVLEHGDLAFGYRSSTLPVGAVITSVEMLLEASDDVRGLRRESGRIIKEKNAAQPTTSWNFGCMFRNPRPHSAGVLIDQAGLKGSACGGARISPLHGNFVENMGAARARDVRTLIERAERAVQAQHGIALVREVRVWPDP